MLFFLKVLLAALAAALLQTTLIPRLALFGAVPDLFLLLVLFVGLRRGGPERWKSAWAIGLGRDLISYGRVGFYCLIFLLAGLAMSRLREHVFTEHPFTQIAIVFFSGLAVGGARLAWEASSAGAHLDKAISGLMAFALYSAAVSPLVFGLLRWVRFSPAGGRA